MPTTIEVSEFQPGPGECNFLGTTVKLRRYYDQDWTDVDGTFHAEGSQGSSTSFFDEINCTLSANTITVPAFPATPTDNAQIGSNVRETWQLWDQAGSPRNVIFEGFIPSANPTITFGALLLLNYGQTLFENDKQTRLDQWIQSYINTVVGVLRFATSVIFGWVRLSVAAANPADPIAVSDNDPRVTADRAANVASIRTLGTGVLQATAGNDARLSDSRAPLVNAPILITLPYVGDGSLIVGKNVKLDGSANAVLTAAGDAGGMVGTVISGGTNTVTIAKAGKVTMTSDGGALVAGRYAQISTSQAGCITATASYPTNGQVLGRILVGGTSPVVDLFGSEVRASLLAGVYLATDYASILAAVTAIGSSPGTLRISTAAYPNGGDVTVPATLILDPIGAGTINITTGQTLTIASDRSRWPLRKLFLNALAGQGTVSYAGSVAQAPVRPEHWGAVVNSGVDCTAAIQAAFVAAETQCADATNVTPATGCGEFRFSPGDYSVGAGVASGAVLTVRKGMDIIFEAGARLAYAALANTVDVLRLKPNAGATNVIDRLRILNAVIWPASGSISARYALNFDLTNSGGFDVYYRNAVFKGCYLGSSVHAVGVTNASGVGGIQASTFEDCFLYGGFNFTNAGDTLRLVNCEITAALGANPSIIDLVSGATGPYIFEMNDTNPQGLWVKSSMGGVIQNSVYEPTAAGAGHNGAIIDIAGGGAAAVSNFVVRNNVISSVGGSTLDGVRVATASTTARVEGNYYNLPAGKRAVYIASGTVTVDTLNEADGSGNPPLYVADAGAHVIERMCATLDGAFSATGGPPINFGDSILRVDSASEFHDREKVITPAGTTGAQTINAVSGSVNFAAGASSLVVTNSRVDTSAVVVVSVATNDATMKTVLVVAAAGSFTIFANAAATAEVRVNFLVMK